MNRIALAFITSLFAVATSPAFAATTDLMGQYWLGR